MHSSLLTVLALGVLGDAGDVRLHVGVLGQEQGVEVAVALLLQPKESAASIENRLAIGLQRESDIRSDEIVGALVSGDRAPIVIREREPQRREADGSDRSTACDRHRSWRAARHASRVRSPCPLKSR